MATATAKETAKNQEHVVKDKLSNNGSMPFTLEETQRSFKHAIMVSTPLLALSSADQQATVRWATDSLADSKNKRSFFSWDLQRGLVATDNQSVNNYKIFLQSFMGKINDEKTFRDEAKAQTCNLAELLNQFENLPSYTVVFIHNTQMFFQYEAVVQGFCNLRDVLKTKSCNIVMLGPSFANTIPLELSNDVVVIDEELPTRTVVADIVKAQFTQLSSQTKGLIAVPDEPAIDGITNFLTGMSPYAVEQHLALSVTRAGVNYRILAQQKQQSLVNIPGLKYEQWLERFSDIGGLNNIKDFFSLFMSGPMKPRVLVRIDEMEKYMAGAGSEGGAGDTSGVSQDALGVVLQAMQDRGWLGAIFVGVPGSGKSLISKALGGEYGLPVISQDLGAARASLVGMSEKNIRQQIKTISGMAGEEAGGALIIATCNKIVALPPELKRRFNLGTWFFDIPTEQELEPIWEINLRKFGLSYNPLPIKNLTGSDVFNICQLAFALKSDLETAYKYVSCLAITEPETLEKLRNAANGRFLATSYEGLYMEPSAKILAEGKRGMEIEEESI